MRIKNWIPLIVILGLVLLEIVWVRANIDMFHPILKGSTLFFQLALAATVIAFLRGVIGVRTFGVFGPAIIALGLIQTSPVTGMMVYLDLFLVAMGTSMALHQIGVPSGFRIAVVIIVTSLTITILELLGEIYHLRALDFAILFPVLITSWLGDRFVMQVREVDWIDPSKRLLGTLFVVLVSFVVISFGAVVEFIALNPETWAVLVGLNLVIAVNIDFRLLELLRFRTVIAKERGTKGIMSLNRRNRRYVLKYNPSTLFPHLTKDRMKVTMHELGIPTPRTFAIIEDRKGLAKAEAVFASDHPFVIKPCSGFGGEGIMVVKRGKGGSLIVKGEDVTARDLRKHIVQILDGQFSSTWSDNALIEQMVVSDPKISEYHFGGVPDIRVIVFRGFPVMAMTRLPTKESGGAANIHKGAIGMGLRISDGRGVNPFWKGHGGTITRHPDTGALLTDMRLPDWKGLLELAATAQAASRLGYAGVDLVMDVSGPMVLEVNKRPGLEIQNTNLEGLLRRIEFVEAHSFEHQSASVKERVALSIKWDREGWK